MCHALKVLSFKLTVIAFCMVFSLACGGGDESTSDLLGDLTSTDNNNNQNNEPPPCLVNCDGDDDDNDDNNGNEDDDTNDGSEIPNLELYGRIDEVNGEWQNPATGFVFKDHFINDDNNGRVWITTKGNAAFIKMVFPAPIRLFQVRLFDIGNQFTQGNLINIDVLSGRLEFFNSVTNEAPPLIEFDNLPPDGSTPLEVDEVFGYVVTDITFVVVDFVDSQGLNRSGLAELEIDGEIVGDGTVERTNLAPFAHITSTTPPKDDDNSNFGVNNMTDGLKSQDDEETCAPLSLIGGDGNIGSFVSAGAGNNTTVDIDFGVPRAIDKVVLYDRLADPTLLNTTNKAAVTQVRLIFDDNSTTELIDIPTSSSCAEIDLTSSEVIPGTDGSEKITKTVKIKVEDSEEGTNGNSATGFAEVRIFGKSVLP